MSQSIQEQKCMARVNRLKKRVLGTRPEMDLENARILTEGFQGAEGEPLVIREAKAFCKQCREKTVTIPFTYTLRTKNYLQNKSVLTGKATPPTRSGLFKFPTIRWPMILPGKCSRLLPMRSKDTAVNLGA